jgi:hypothetical protein
MIFGFNHAAGESDVDQVSQRLCWPLRIGESIRVSGAIYLVSLDAFFFLELTRVHSVLACSHACKLLPFQELSLFLVGM